MLGVFDLVTAGVIAAGYHLGRGQGLVWQASGIGTLLVGGACATVLAHPFGPVFADGILGRFVAWIAVYVLVALCLYVISLKLKHRIKELEFDELDKRYGGVLGAIQALLVFGVMVVVVVCLSSGLERTVKASLAGRLLREAVTEAGPLVPERVHQILDLPRAAPVPAPTPSPAPTVAPAPAPATPRVTPTPPAPRPTRPSPPPPQPDAVEPDPLDPEPDPEPAPDHEDPFDTQKDPVDPLAPPR